MSSYSAEFVDFLITKYIPSKAAYAEKMSKIKNADAGVKELMKFAKHAKAKNDFKKSSPDFADFEPDEDEIKAECEVQISSILTSNENNEKSKKSSDSSDSDSLELEIDSSAEIPTSDVVKSSKSSISNVSSVSSSKRTSKSSKNEPKTTITKKTTEKSSTAKKSASKSAKDADNSDQSDNSVNSEPSIEVEVSDEKPEKPRRSSKSASSKKSTSKSASSKKAEKAKANLKNGSIDYSKAGLDAKIINSFATALKKLFGDHKAQAYPEGLTEHIKEYKSHYGENGSKIENWSAISAKIQTENLVIKYQLYGEKAEGNYTQLRNAPIVKYTPTSTSKNAEEMSVIKAFAAYITHLQSKIPEKKKKWSPVIAVCLNSDILYKFGALDFEGILDTTRQLPISNYKYNYDYESSDEFSYRNKDYGELYTYIRPTTAHFTGSRLRSAMKNIYKERRRIIYHEKILPEIEKLWKNATEDLDSLYDEDPKNASITLDMWHSIMHSEQCKNIIAYGWPCRPEFDAFIKDLLSEVETTVLMLHELFPICFIFTPFAIRIPKVPKASIIKNPQNCVDTIIKEVVDSNDTYAECRWASGSLEDAEDEDGNIFRKYFDNEKFTVKKEKKSKDDEDKDEDKENEKESENDEDDTDKKKKNEKKQTKKTREEKKGKKSSKSSKSKKDEDESELEIEEDADEE